MKLWEANDSFVVATKHGGYFLTHLCTSCGHEILNANRPFRMKTSKELLLGPFSRNCEKRFFFNFIVSVDPSACMEQLGSHGMDFHEI